MKKIFPHIFVGFAVIFMFALGTWQAQRLEWKQDLIPKINARTVQAPISISDVKNIEDDEFKPVKISGKYLHDKQMILLNKQFNGKAGYHTLTPLKTNDGQIIIVNRGWTPSDKDPEQPTDMQNITGVVRGTQQLNFIGRHIIFDNTPDKNQWFWIDLPKIYPHIGAENKPFYLDLINEKNSKTFPYALPKKNEIYNEHLQYAITWYSLALALVVMYYFRFWRKK